jgi:hypothetical protein
MKEIVRRANISFPMTVDQTKMNTKLEMQHLYKFRRRCAFPKGTKIPG